jgi:hypothetical protein
MGRRHANGRIRRIPVVALRPREGPFTEPNAGPQPWPAERVLVPDCVEKVRGLAEMAVVTKQ